MIAQACYIVVTCDESMAVDNTSWLCLYVYIVHNWGRKPLPITLQKLESNGSTVDSLLIVITRILASHGKMEPHEIATKLMCFGVDGVSSF